MFFHCLPVFSSVHLPDKTLVPHLSSTHNVQQGCIYDQCSHLFQFVSCRMVVTRPHCFLFTCSCSVLTSVSLCLQFPHQVTASLPCSLITWMLVSLSKFSAPFCNPLGWNRIHSLTSRTLTGLPSPKPHNLCLQVSPQNQYSSLLHSLSPHSKNLTKLSLCSSASTSETQHCVSSCCHFQFLFSQ